MDPTHFLLSQTFQNNTPSTSPDAVDAFYQTHGHSPFHALYHWRAALRAAWHGLRIDRPKTTDIAPLGYQS